MNIEILESRIAPAALAPFSRGPQPHAKLPAKTPPGISFVFTDVDGDTVKITSSKGKAADLGNAVAKSNGQLQKLDLSFGKWGNEFAGANVTIAVTQRGATGNGIVNVGAIDATGIDLGIVVVKGDLGSIAGGKSASGGVRSLTVNSLGKLGTTTGAANNFSSITGSGALTVLGNIDGASIDYSAKLTALTVTGSVIGSGADLSGAISANGAGAIKIGGSLQGSSGFDSGTITLTGPAGAITIGGDVIGDAGISSGSITGNSTGAITIGGTIKGGSIVSAGSVDITGTVGDVAIGGAILGGTDSGTGSFVAGKAGKISIGGDVKGGGSSNAGTLSVTGATASITVGGSVIGGSDSNAGSIFSGNTGAVKIGGRVEGGAGPSTGSLVLNNAASVTIGSDLIGGGGNDAGAVILQKHVGTIKIGGSFTGAQIRAAGSIGTLTIGGDLAGGKVLINTTIGAQVPVTVASAIAIGGSVSNAQIVIGNFLNPDVQIGKLTVGGDWTASSLIVGVKNLGTDDSIGGAGAAADNVNFGDSHDARITGGKSNVVASIASIVIGGAINGTVGGTDHFGFVAEQIGSFSIAGFALPLTTHKDAFTIGTTADTTIHEV